jgi:hypothetical protein
VVCPPGLGERVSHLYVKAFLILIATILSNRKLY